MDKPQRIHQTRKRLVVQSDIFSGKTLIVARIGAYLIRSKEKPFLFIQPPDANTLVTWSTAIAILIIAVRQQINAMAGQKRGEKTQQVAEDTNTKVSSVHQITANGQLQILETRAVALRALALIRKSPSDDKAAIIAEQELATYRESLGA
jgi:hypothetical protein